MFQSGKRGLNAQQLRIFLFGWLGVSAIAAICMFVGILVLFNEQTGGASGTRQPTPRPVVQATQPIIIPNATAPTATAASASPGTPQDNGRFALGGQVQPYFDLPHMEEMHQAGMSWVKYQIVWTPESRPKEARDLIDFAHQYGFKVLLSVKGDLNPTSIDYAAYVSYFQRLMNTEYLPDAVEVWNEMNFDKEWPANDISGRSYVTNMLQPVHQVIKARSQDIIVITGAPTPTGAFGGSCGSVDTGVSIVSGCDDNYYLTQMRDAGAANYSDCIGVHFNSGGTSPSVSSGHPSDNGVGHYSWYFQPMLNLYYNTFNKPLCFTELGFVSAEGFGTPPVNFPWANQLTVAQQAQWLGETVAMANTSGKVRLVIIWNLDFPSDAPDDPKSMYAIIRPDGTCPACAPLLAGVNASP